MRRLWELVRFGFLEKRCVVIDGQGLYQVSQLALAEVERRGGRVLPYLGAVDLKGYQHDLRVTDCRITFERLRATGWQSERRLYQSGLRGHLPDATFQLGENRCALELELSLKRLDRYPPIFCAYAESRREVGTVFYLCGQKGMRETLGRIAGQSRRFYFALWDDFAARPAEAVFSNQHDRLTLKELI
jgi:hypothetical protein